MLRGYDTPTMILLIIMLALTVIGLGYIAFLIVGGLVGFLEVTIVEVGLVFVETLVGLSLIAILLFGIRSMIYKKVNPFMLVIVLIPILVLVALGFIVGDWSKAAIFTVLIMFGLAILGLLYTGIRGLFA